MMETDMFLSVVLSDFYDCLCKITDLSARSFSSLVETLDKTCLSLIPKTSPAQVMSRCLTHSTKVPPPTLEFPETVLMIASWTCVAACLLASYRAQCIARDGICCFLLACLCSHFLALAVCRKWWSLSLLSPGLAAGTCCWLASPPWPNSLLYSLWHCVKVCIAIKCTNNRNNS